MVGGAIPRGWFLRQNFHHDLFERGRDIGNVFADGNGLVFKVHSREFFAGGGVERERARKDFVQHNAERIHIGCGRRRFANGLLRREILWRAPDHVGAFVGHDRGKRARDAEVSHFESAIRRDDHVVRFYVAVDEPGAMGVTNAGAGLHDERNRFFNSESSALAEDGFEVFAGQILHDNEQLPRVVAKVVNGDDVRVREVCRGARFHFEAFLERRVFGIILVQDFDGNIALEHQIARAEHVGHSARAELFEKLITLIEKRAGFHDEKIISS